MRRDVPTVMSLGIRKEVVGKKMKMIQKNWRRREKTKIDREKKETREEIKGLWSKDKEKGVNGKKVQIKED